MKTNQDIQAIHDELVVIKTRIGWLIREIEARWRQDHSQASDSASEWQANTGVNPAPGEAVHVKFRDGSTSDRAYVADEYDWRLRLESDDIIAWKLATQTGD